MSESEIFLKRCKNRPVAFYLLDKSIFSDPWTQEIWKSAFIEKDYLNYLIVHNRKISGFITLRMIKSEKAAELDKIGILSGFQKKNIGFMSLNILHQEVYARGIHSIFLEVSDKNRSAVSLYEKYGYNIYHKRKNYYKDGSTAICMRKILTKWK